MSYNEGRAEALEKFGIATIAARALPSVTPPRIRGRNLGEFTANIEKIRRKAPQTAAQWDSVAKLLRAMPEEWQNDAYIGTGPGPQIAASASYPRLGADPAVRNAAIEAEQRRRAELRADWRSPKEVRRSRPRPIVIPERLMRLPTPDVDVAAHEIGHTNDPELPARVLRRMRAMQRNPATAGTQLISAPSETYASLYAQGLLDRTSPTNAFGLMTYLENSPQRAPALNNLIADTQTQALRGMPQDERARIQAIVRNRDAYQRGIRNVSERARTMSPEDPRRGIYERALGRWGAASNSNEQAAVLALNPYVNPHLMATLPAELRGRIADFDARTAEGVTRRLGRGTGREGLQFQQEITDARR